MTSMTSSRGAMPPNRGGGILAAAWLLLIALFAGVGAWVFAVTRGVEVPVAPKALPTATLSLPPAKTAAPPSISDTIAAITETPKAGAAPKPAVPTQAPTAPVAPAPVAVEPPPASRPAPPVATAASAPPSVTVAPPRLPGQPLAPIEPALTRDSPYGPLPRLSADRKRAPWQVYAAPFDVNDPRPRIAVVVTGLGLAKDLTDRAITTLPPQISLSFSPYAAETPTAVATARQRGHEVLLDLALEPINYPTVDPGPATLIGAYSATDNVARLDWVLARAPGAIGVIAQYGPSFGASPMAMAPVAQALRERGLMYVDNRASDLPAMIRLSRDFALPWSFADVTVGSDTAAQAEALMTALRGLETASATKRTSVVLVPASPVALLTLATWAPTLDRRGFALAPVSATASRQDERDAVRP